MEPGETAREKSKEERAPFVFGVSGHRDLVASDIPELRRQLDIVFARFCAAHSACQFQLLTPLAEGADRLAAEVALAHGINLWVPMPMAQADYERDFTAPESLAEFRRLLGFAERVWRIDSPANTSRDDQYAAVGDFIARTSHVLVLFWDGQLNEMKGGTGWVKLRRDHWIGSAGMNPGPPGYVGTIQIVTPRATGAKRGERQPRIEVKGELPA
ncbi:MAG TPA: hypothetical protein VM940_09320 [Chthoniobacterales bacterium]|jgi:hypothetical protein|nr:hypothetical protein [Chthoniobacterales bacterium]